MANLTKDQRIMRDNPTATPYQLLELGLSDKKYQELMAEEEKKSGKKVGEESVDEVLGKTNQPQELNVAKSLGEDTEHEFHQVELKEVPEAAPAPKAKATIEQQHHNVKAAPKLAPAPKQNVASGMAYLVNKKTGKRTYMTAESAHRRKKAKPNDYEIQS